MSDSQAAQAMDSLESRSEVVDYVTPPELSQVQKNQVLILQRQILSMKVNINNLEKQLEQMGPAMNELLSKIAKELCINPEAFTFDLDNLKLVSKV